MFDFDVYRDCVWPAHLRPEGEGTWEKEPFVDWWSRHRDELAHLPSELMEQWVHRHWEHSRFSFLPLGSLECSLVTMTGDEVLSAVTRVYARTLHPEFDYQVFAEPTYSKEKLPTARALDEGTWDFPLVVLETPLGIKRNRQEHPDVRLVLVEGHQRHRYLNALHERGTPPKGPHKLFVLRSMVVD